MLFQYLFWLLSSLVECKHIHQQMGKSTVQKPSLNKRCDSSDNESIPRSEMMSAGLITLRNLDPLCEVKYPTQSAKDQVIGG